MLKIDDGWPLTMNVCIGQHFTGLAVVKDEEFLYIYTSMREIVLFLSKSNILLNS